MCSLNGKLYFFIPLAIVTIYFIFRFIYALINEYIIPAVIYIIDWLGVLKLTVLVLGNNIHSIIMAIVSGGTNTGVSFNIGILFGTGLFLFAVSISYTIRKSPKEI